jgi:hypothetical protein
VFVNGSNQEELVKKASEVFEKKKKDIITV